MNKSSKQIPDVELAQQLHNETARIKWRELQRFFAQGTVLQIADECDLLAIALMLAQDNAEQLKPFLADGRVAAPSNSQAQAWYDADDEVWSVVVAPFVLVQSSI